ncbi:hypothetical protein [Aeromicrobium sp.]|uniref:hypothetical protein n=1 Tax=Aeromicrobium sp. TaxID=1871063 RepID=UPI00403412F6
MSAGLAVLMGLLLPSHRRLAKVACVLVVVLPVVSTVPLVLLAQTADRRHAAALDTFPASGSSRPATDSEAQLVSLEAQTVVRVWDASGLTCDQLGEVFSQWAGRPADRVESSLGLPDTACIVETEAAWTGRRAAVMIDGRLVVGVWSPTVDLFVF